MVEFERYVGIHFVFCLLLYIATTAVLYLCGIVLSELSLLCLVQFFVFDSV